MRDRERDREREAHMRASTLDFKRSLEMDEWKARERVRVLGLGNGICE